MGASLPLLSKEGGANPSTSASTSGGGVDQPKLTQLNFLLMSGAVSVTHACMILGMNYASSVLDTRLGIVSNSLLNFAYTLGALLTSTHMVDSLKPRRALIVASFAYLIYISLFTVVSLNPSPKLPSRGGVVGGEGVWILMVGWI